MELEVEITNIESAILGLLLEKPMYGYEIEKLIEERGMRCWTEIAFSSIYYVLKKLEEKNLVETKIVNESGRARKIYASTETGEAVMKKKVKSLISNYEKLISGFDLGMSNLWILSKEEAEECFENYQSNLEDITKTIKEIKNRMESQNRPLHVLALSDRALNRLNSEKKFIKEFKEKFKEKN